MSIKWQPASHPATETPPASSSPVFADFGSDKLTVSAGVAIFHLASSRVVVCRHSKDRYWFLPKGRRDASEDSGAGAEREGFEESGYRNRLLPIPLRHRQPRPHNTPSKDLSPFVTEPIWTQLIPQTSASQYILFWYIAETIPPDTDNSPIDVDADPPSVPQPYQPPVKYPSHMTLSARVALEPMGYEPVHHENTGVDSEEAFYVSYLMPIPEAAQKLQGTIQEQVVVGGWEAICRRWKMEDGS
ncbi:MAG: hypothetical protein M1833_000574 [Piccolia ochrophora]|nr:MAG: hypothetical protein M1833_000574 [Piccolia ochrophora]